MKDLLDIAQATFEAQFGSASTTAVAAPGRVNIIGEHVDYNDGFVLPMAIEYYCVIAAAPVEDNTVTLFSTFGDQLCSFTLDEDLKPGEPAWANYIKGSLAGCLAKGINAGGFNAVYHSNVPVGGGLSSSAALEVATATLAQALSGKELDPVDRAFIAQQAEHDWAGVPCGIMDQFISSLGKKDHLLMIDCQSIGYELVPMADPDVSVLIVNSNVSHSLTDGGYAARRAQCDSALAKIGASSWRDVSAEDLEAAKDKLDELEYRRGHHVVGEIARTPVAAKAIAEGRWEDAGFAMYASHASLRDDFEVSCDELDAIVRIAQKIGKEGGVIGCRMTGGGFGGCAVCLVHTDHLAEISYKIAAAYKEETGIEATLFSSRPAEGAQILV